MLTDRQRPVGFESGGFASNGATQHSPGGYSLVAALVCEFVKDSFAFLFGTARPYSTPGRHKSSDRAVLTRST